MKIQNEVWLVVAIVAFLLSWLIDRLAGPVTIVVGNPIAFLRSPVLLNTYPFTATAIIIRSIGLFISTMLAITIIEKNYFTKAIILFFVGMLAEFYAVQQLATGFHLTTIQWTLSIAYGAMILILGIVAMIFVGIWASFGGGEESPRKTSEDQESILEPPTEQ